MKNKGENLSDHGLGEDFLKDAKIYTIKEK